MHSIRPTTIIAAVSAVIVMALALTANATARRIAISERNFLAAWTTFKFNDGGNIISCPVTLDGSFHSRTISKVCGALVGYINRAVVVDSACTGGNYRALEETLPWHIRYSSFSGTLPSISSIRIAVVGARIQAGASGLTCLFATTAAHPVFFDIQISEGRARTIRVLPEFRIPLQGEFFCQFVGEGEWEGTGTVSGSAPERPAISVTLVQ
jgi:hypothetical protein